MATDEKTTRLTAEEKAAIDTASASSRALIAQAQQGGLTEVPIDDIEDDDKVPVLVPASFVLVTDQHKRYRFPVGLHQCPQALLDHWYVKAQGVRIYDMGQKQKIAAAVIVPQGLPAEFEIGEKKVAVAELVLSILSDTGLPADTWNALPDDQRKMLIEQKVQMSIAAASAGASTSATAGKGEAQAASTDTRGSHKTRR